MSGTEDYLDGLLNSLEGNKTPETTETERQIEDMEIDTEGEHMGSEDEFLDSFEKEILSDGGDDEFIRQFEKELNDGTESGSGESGVKDDKFFESLDGIVNNAKQEMQADNGLDDMMVDTLGDFALDVSGDAAETTASSSGEADFVDDDADLMDLLSSEGDFSDIGDMLKADEENTALADESDAPDAGVQMAGTEEAEAAGAEEKTEGRKRGKKEKKPKNSTGQEAGKGFFGKVSSFLFGDDEEEEEKQPQPVTAAPAAPSIEDLSDENLQILQALEGTPEAAAEPETPVETEEEKKERIKREKAEKKAQAKKEKAEKKAQAKKEKEQKKAQKVKKPKPPKEPDNTPPLPKKPVVLIFVMAASFLALVLVGTNLFGYSNSMEQAKQAYQLGDYELAYAQVSGMEIKETDTDTYEKYRIMANAGGEYSAYQTFMAQGIYDMALDSLIRTIGRCDKYSAEAESYGCANELMNVRNQAVGALAGFGLTEERAKELYAVDEREEYSAELYAVLAAAGLSVE